MPSPPFLRAAALIAARMPFSHEASLVEICTDVKPSPALLRRRTGTFHTGDGNDILVIEFEIGDPGPEGGCHSLEIRSSRE